MGERRVYTKEFKQNAVEMYENSGRPGHETEEELGIGRGQIYRWRKELRANGDKAFPGNGNQQDDELTRLRKENAELREERDILRKAVAIFSDRRRK
jgi:transposase